MEISSSIYFDYKITGTTKTIQGSNVFDLISGNSSSTITLFSDKIAGYPTVDINITNVSGGGEKPITLITCNGKTLYNAYVSK